MIVIVIYYRNHQQYQYYHAALIVGLALMPQKNNIVIYEHLFTHFEPMTISQKFEILNLPPPIVSDKVYALCTSTEPAVECKSCGNISHIAKVCHSKGKQGTSYHQGL